MQAYANGAALREEIKATAERLIQEFGDIAEADMDLRLEGADRTPREVLAYQLGWMALIRGWDSDERAGKAVVTPDPGYRWNHLGALYEGFYARYAPDTLLQLTRQFNDAVSDFIIWLEAFSEEELFLSGGRKWAQSTPANWPIWKWVHINTVAPFTSFRSKIRKWKKLRLELG